MIERSRFEKEPTLQGKDVQGKAKSMPSQAHSQLSSKLPSFAEALAATNKMQQDWLEHDVNFVERYVEDVDGNWLEEWGIEEPTENSSAPSDICYPIP